MHWILLQTTTQLDDFFFLNSKVVLLQAFLINYCNKISRENAGVKKCELISATSKIISPRCALDRISVQQILNFVLKNKLFCNSVFG